VNVVLVLALAFRFQGPGIAFALSFSSAMNTGLLVWALIKGNIEGVRHELWDALKYAIRMAIFSAVAVVPALFVDRAVYAKVADAHSRLISAGVPLVAGTVVFAAVGIALLVLTKDSVAASITNAFSRKTRGRGR
jgi:peptidoglycan biosynthesis protein MviN/MurJ (putative lipid II flippase)